MNIREMKFTKICWLGFAIGPLLMCGNALATGHALSNAPSVHGGGSWQITSNGGQRRPNTQRPRAHIGKSHKTGNLETRNDYRSGYVAGLREGKHVTTQRQRNSRESLSAEKYALREHAERDARAERIYRSSQLSVPIIIDAKACKRIGRHGESIYENCQLATTCNPRAGVATCQPAE